MARPIKQGLDYFPLDVGFLQDVKIRRIMRACGIQSIPVLISLLANIYRNDGYFLRWDNDMPFLIADELGVSEGAVTATVDKAVQVDFFNANMFQEHGVLTSEGIQSRYFEAVTRRSSVRYDARFLLINVYAYKNLVNVDNNSVNVDSNTQSKVKESKGNKSKEQHKPIGSDDDDFGTLVKFFSNNFHPIVPYESELLSGLYAEYGNDNVKHAMTIAIQNNARNIKYVDSILRNVSANGWEWEKTKGKGASNPFWDKIHEGASSFAERRKKKKGGDVHDG